MIFIDFRRPAASTPPFCMIFCGANDGTHRVKHAQPPGRQPIHIHTPPTSTTIDTPTAHDTGRSLFSIKQRLTDSLVEQIPNTTCSEENLYEKFCLPQTLCPNSQYRRRLAFCIFAWKGRKKMTIEDTFFIIFLFDTMILHDFSRRNQWSTPREATFLHFHGRVARK